MGLWQRVGRVLGSHSSAEPGLAAVGCYHSQDQRDKGMEVEAALNKQKHC